MTDTPESAPDAPTVTAFFDSRIEALRAIDRLTAIGLPDGCLHLTEGKVADDTPSAAPEGTDDTRGFFDALTDFFFPPEDRAAYAEGLSRGGYLVTARHIPAGLYDTVIDVLDDEGAVDIDERAATWRSGGWDGGGQDDRTDDPVRAVGGDVDPGTSGMAGMDTPHAGVTADRLAESRGMITPQDRRGDLWQRDMARGRSRVRAYVPVGRGTEDSTGPDATERGNPPS